MTVPKNNIRRFKSEPVAPQFLSDNVDADAGIIRNVVMAQAGPAKGHGFSIDRQFIADLVAYDIQHFSDTGVKARFGHPALSDTTMGKQMGVFKNFRYDGDKAIADLHLLASSDKSPTVPKMREWVLSMANERPDFMMSSIVFRIGGFFQLDDDGGQVDIDEFDRWGNPILKFEDKELFASFREHFYTDLVEQGAVTDNLFSQQFNQDKFAIQVIEFVQEHPALLKFLKENPSKLLEFSEKLGIELPKPKFSFGEKLTALKEIFAPSNPEAVAPETDTEDLRPELEALQSGLAETERQLTAAQTRIEELETGNRQLATDNAALRERVPDQPTDVDGDGAQAGEVEELDPVTAKARAEYLKRKKKAA